MIFLSYWFVFFVILFFPLYWIIRIPIVRLSLLIVSCTIFYIHFAGIVGVIPLLILGALTYICGYLRNKSLCIAAIGICVSALVFYKYTKFICESLIGLISPQLAELSFQAVDPILPDVPPLAISFFVFEFVHYLYEIIKGGEPIKKVSDFTLFALFWPSVVAGPIKRYQQFIPEIKQGIAKVSKEDISHGLVRVAVGLIKKMAADNLTIYVTYWSERFADISPMWRWILFVLIALRIYWDFSGYSDMAIGYSRMMGIQLPENFNFPYVASNLADFWHRWHISLSLWIRDYVYIPLGGSRRGLVRKIANGLIAFGICGLWHGSAWNFLVWGLYHGVGLAISSNYEVLLGKLGKLIRQLFATIPLLGWAVTMLYVGIGWILFFYPLSTAFEMIKLLFGVS